MRAFDVVGIGVTLVLVPALAWLLGRYAGRRDWRVTSLLLAAALLAIVVQVDVLAALAALETRAGTGGGQDFLLVLGRRIVEALSMPEFSAFLLIFGSFIGLLGWSATPARKAESAASTG